MYRRSQASLSVQEEEPGRARYKDSQAQPKYRDIQASQVQCQVGQARPGTVSGRRPSLVQVPWYPTHPWYPPVPPTHPGTTPTTPGTTGAPGHDVHHSASRGMSRQAHYVKMEILSNGSLLATVSHCQEWPAPDTVTTSR